MKIEEVIQQLEEKQEAVQKGKQKKVLFAVVLALLCIVILGVTLLPNVIPSGQSDYEAPVVEAAIMDGYPQGIQEAELVEAIQEEMDNSMFKITQQVRVVFENSSAKGTVNIINGEGNRLPARITITDKENNRLLYENKELLWPGKYIPEIRLAENLKKGVYEGLVTYYVYDEKGEKEQGVLSANLEIVIQN